MAPTTYPALALGLATSVGPDRMDTMSATPTTTTTYPTATEWLASDRRGRNAIVRDVRATFAAHMAAGDNDAAMVAMVALASYVVPTERPAVVIDYATLVADRIATLNAAIVALRTGAFDGAPDGFTFDDDVDGTVDTDAVARLATVRRATRRDLASHVVAVVTGEWMSVADVRRAIIADTDGSYVPSDGAVAAVLFDGATPRTNVDDGAIVCTVATSDRPRGCYRA